MVGERQADGEMSKSREPLMYSRARNQKYCRWSRGPDAHPDSLQAARMVSTEEMEASFVEEKKIEVMLQHFQGKGQEEGG